MKPRWKAYRTVTDAPLEAGLMALTRQVFSGCGVMKADSATIRPLSQGQESSAMQVPVAQRRSAL